MSCVYLLLTSLQFQSVAECGLVAFLELFGCEFVILRALVLDFDRTHEARDATRRFPTEVVDEPVQQARAIRVTAAGRIFDGLRLRGRDLEALGLGVNLRALASERDDQSLDPRRDVFHVPTG